MNEKKRGGAGRGQGRKPKTDKFVKRQIFFRPDQLEKLSGKNLSVEIRKLIDFSYDFISSEKTEWQPPKTERTNHIWRNGACLWCGLKKDGKVFFTENGERLENRPDCLRGRKPLFI